MALENISRYEIREELGRGGMATVFRGFDPRFKREVAIKLLPREFLHDPNFRARFDREATTIASLEHSAIVPVYDFGEEDGQPYLVMRFMPGGSLAEKLNDGSIPLEETVAILGRIAGALDFAHENGVIHRDLKPANILFDKRGDAYLADFGIVKLTEEAATLTGAGGIIGTPAYMSPEQAQGKGGIDNRSDLYSLGVILFQMLTGKQPYEADTPIGLAVMHINEPTPDILKAQPDLPAGIGTFIQKAMAKAKGDRFGTAQELAGAFEASTREEVVEAREEPQLDPTLIDNDAEVVEEVVVPAPPISEQPTPAIEAPRRSGFNILPILGIGGIIVVVGGIALFALGGGMDLFAPAPEPTPSPTPTHTAIPTVTQTTTPKPTSTITSTPTTAFDPRAMVEIARPLDGPYNVHAVAWSPDGSMLAAVDRGKYSLNTGESENGNLHVWETSGFSALLANRAVNNNYPGMAAWASDSSLLATSGRGIVQIWDPQTWEISGLLNISEMTGIPIGSIKGVAWSPASANVLAISISSGRIHLWDIETGESQLEICCPIWSRASFAWSSTGEKIAGMTGTGETRNVNVWDVDTGDLLVSVSVRYGRVLDLSPSGEQILSVRWEELYSTNFLYVWDVASGNQVQRVQLDDFAIMARWSPDSEVIAVARQYVIELRDSATGELLHTLEGYDPAVGVSTIMHFDWSPDGTMLAAASLDGTVRVFGIPEG